MKLKFIVTGTGRCGTVYMARVLTKMGVPCGHECIFNNERPDVIMKRFLGQQRPKMSDCSENFGWVDLRQVVADSSYMAAFYLVQPLVCEVPVIHVVRHPLAVISSFVKDLKYFCGEEDNFYNKKGWEEWICHRISELRVIETPIEKACYFYTEWNQRIEDCKAPYIRHRIEDEFSDELFAFLEIPPQKNTFRNKRINTMKKREEDFTLGDIPEGEIKQNFSNMMEKYGYLDSQSP
jgi:hypothetical protein